MDLKKIFLKEACPTSIGGQAIMEGIMMRGPKKTAIAVRLPDGNIHMKTQPCLLYTSCDPGSEDNCRRRSS